MSRPATAARSSSRTHSVDSRASLRRSVSATLAGIWAGWCHEPWAASNRVSSLTKNGLPPLRCHSPAVTSAGRLVPASSPASAPTSSGVRPVRTSCWAWPATSRSSPDASVSRYAPSSSTARAVRARARNLSSRNDGSSAQCRSSRTTSTGRPAARRPRHRDTASNKRNWASAAAAALAGSAAPEPDCSSQPASPSSAAGRPLARSTCDQGQYGGAPSPSQQNPRRTRGTGPAWPISAASIAVLPMPASPLIIRNCPAPRRASSSTELAAASAGSRPMSRLARLMASSWLVRVAVPTPGSSGPGHRACGRGRTRRRPPRPAAAAARPGRAARMTWPFSGTPRSACRPGSRRRRTCARPG